ncbi:MAG: hypothetical protein HY720_23750 [Planctomycetes bacterium]|nr:hypothetical protein [Planctomycetota bacterium]
MKTFVATIAAAVLATALAGTLAADEVRLRDGTVYRGKVLSADSQTVVIRVYEDLSEQRIPTALVQRAQRGPDLFEQYERKLAAAGDKANSWYELAGWCRRGGLIEYARQAYEKTIELDPEHRGARSALGYVKVKDEWVIKEPSQTPEARYFKTQVIALDLWATYPGDATRDQLAAFGNRVREASKYSWRMSQEQLYVRSVVVEDKCSPGQGHLMIAEGTWNSYRIRQGVYGEAGSTGVHIAGQMLAYTFFHESMHWLMGIPDEYDPQGMPACPPCVMSANPSADALCDPASHVGQGASCWERLVANAPKVGDGRYRRKDGELWQVKYPNPNAGKFELPETEVKIRDK